MSDVWAELNDRQRAYLRTIYDCDQVTETRRRKSSRVVIPIATSLMADGGQKSCCRYHSGFRAGDVLPSDEWHVDPELRFVTYVYLQGYELACPIIKSDN
jgi:hypothetical protein